MMSEQLAHIMLVEHELSVKNVGRDASRSVWLYREPNPSAKGTRLPQWMVGWVERVRSVAGRNGWTPVISRG